MADKIKQRRDTQDNWKAVNPILDEGELGIITDRNTAKIGDGTTGFNDLQSIYGVPEDWVNVKDFGAKGDGETNDTQAFQAAISTNKNIYVPNGTYVLTSELQLHGQQIILGNRLKSVLKFLGCNGIRMVSGTRVIGLYLHGDNTQHPKGTGGTPGTIGIYLYGNPANIVIMHSSIRYFGETAIKIIDGMNINLNNIDMQDNGANPGEGVQGASIKFHGSRRNVAPTTATLENIFIRDGSEYGFYGDGGTDIHFKNFTVEYHHKAMHLERMYYVLLENIYFEANATNDVEVVNSLVTFINARVNDNNLITDLSGNAPDSRYIMNMSFPDFSGRDFKGRNFTVDGDLKVQGVPIRPHSLNYNSSFTFSNSNGSTRITGHLEQSVDTPVIAIPKGYKLFISIYIGHNVELTNLSFLGYVQNDHLYNLDGTEFVSKEAYIKTPGTLGTYDLMLRCDDHVDYRRSFSVCLLGY